MEITQEKQQVIRNTFNRLKQLRMLGAPRWIIKNEQLILLDLVVGLSDNEYEGYLNRIVRPLMDGVGYITIHDGGYTSTIH